MTTRLNSACQGAAAASLLDLPYPCLEKVLRCCAAGDQRSVCSAARAHSRLHQAAVTVLHSITAKVQSQEQLDSLVEQYLPSHGQNVSSISLHGAGEAAEAEGFAALRQLPPTLTKLTSLQLSSVQVQLGACEGHPGVLGAVAAAAPPLKQLLLDECTLWDGEYDPEAALTLLPGLEHLSISFGVEAGGHDVATIPGHVLKRLQQLTYLELARVWLRWPYEILGEDDTVDLQQHLSALTRLADLRLVPMHNYRVTADALAGVQHLTLLQLSGWESASWYLEPAALAGKTRLQHLELHVGELLAGAAGVAQLLSQLQHLQQLTCLDLYHSLRKMDAYPPAAAYSALTASSKLRHLSVSYCTLPAGAWQHVFPAGRQLPHLQSLDIAGVRHPARGPAAAPEGSRLVSCCPRLQSLDLRGLQHSPELLAALQGLSGLHSLSLHSCANAAGMAALCQLTGLRCLEVDEGCSPLGGLLLQLTQLRQLTHLTYGCQPHHGNVWLSFPDDEAPSSGPVWRQVLQYHREHGDPAVEQPAAAALAE